jgi:transposase
MSSLETFLARLDKEWTDGCHNGAALCRKLKAAGFSGSHRVVTEWATCRRQEEVAASDDKRPRKWPSARAIARMMTVERDKLSKTVARPITIIEGAVPRLTAARDLIDRFHNLIRGRASAYLEAWFAAAKPSLVASFAKGIVQDHAAVKAALSEPWSNGQTKGHNTKLKLVKRQMYGRAGLDLLRAACSEHRNAAPASAPTLRQSHYSAPIYTFRSAMVIGSRSEAPPQFSGLVRQTDIALMQPPGCPR